MSNFFSGSSDSFDTAWKNTVESNYIHWSPSIPQNQIQLAFRSHYNLFKSIHKNPSPNPSILEIGCGRGSLSAHYAQAGWSCSLLDSSASIISKAKKIFTSNSLRGNFYIGDAENLPFDSDSFDVTTSIGLIEHFDDPRKVISEHLRVVKPGGWTIMYIVPSKPVAVQDIYDSFVSFLRPFKNNRLKRVAKEPVFRTTYLLSEYNKYIPRDQIQNIYTTGTYPMPMISSSPDFPFTLCSPPVEKLNVLILSLYLFIRSLLTRSHYWTCSENYGHSILIALQKK